MKYTRFPTALTVADIEAIKSKVQRAIDSRAVGVGHFSKERKIAFVGLVADDRLITWFSSPADSEDDAKRLHHIVMSGLEVVQQEALEAAKITIGSFVTPRDIPLQ